MSDRLSEIAEREKAATPVDWEHGYYKNAHTIFWSRGNGTVPIATVYEATSKGNGSDNADFIAAARRDIPWLLANTQQALALIRSVRDGNGWREIPLGVLNQIEAILLGDTNETENHDGK